MAAKMAVRQAKEPELETTEWVETDPETGTSIRVVRNQRGVLVNEIRRYDSLLVGLNKLANDAPVRKVLEGFCDNLRDYLEGEGLPSDRTPLWVRVKGGDWQPDTGERPVNTNLDRASWNALIDRTTEQLSRQRVAGQLLLALTQLLARKT